MSRFRARRNGLTFATLSTLVALVGVLSTSATSGAAASAASSYEVTAVGGSGSYLVYARVKLAGADRAKALNTELYVMNDHGRSRLLGTILTHDVDTLTFAAPYLGYFDSGVKPGTRARLWNVRTGKETSPEPPSGLAFVGAAPTGYLAESPTSSNPKAKDIDLVSATTGKVTSFGSPYAGGQLFDYAAGASSIVAYVSQAEDKGGVKSAALSTPGQFVTLAGSGTSFCGAPDQAYVACRVFGAKPALRLYRLSGKLVHRTTKHGQSNFLPAPTVLGSSAYWIGVSHHYLWEMSSAGTMTRSAKTFADSAPIRALHRVVVNNSAKTELLGLKTAGGAAHLMARA